MYTGEADWTNIGLVKANPRMHIPIIGNGDITSAEEACKAFERYGVDAVMIGRATFGRPWIFHEIAHPELPLSLDEKVDILKQQVLISIDRASQNPMNAVHGPQLSRHPNRHASRRENRRSLRPHRTNKRDAERATRSHKRVDYLWFNLYKYYKRQVLCKLSNFLSLKLLGNILMSRLGTRLGIKL